MLELLSDEKFYTQALTHFQSLFFLEQLFPKKCIIFEQFCLTINYFLNSQLIRSLLLLQEIVISGKKLNDVFRVIIQSTVNILQSFLDKSRIFLQLVLFQNYLYIFPVISFPEFFKLKKPKFSRIHNLSHHFISNLKWN